MIPTFWNDLDELRDCRVLERNGGLVLVENAETGEVDWVDYRDVQED